MHHHELPMPKILTCPCHCPVHGRRMAYPRRIRPSPYPMYNYCFNGLQPNGYNPYPMFGAVPTTPYQPQNYAPQYSGFQPYAASPMQQQPPPPETSSKDVRNRPTGALNVLQKRYKKVCKNNPEAGIQTPREEEVEEKFMEALMEKDQQAKESLPHPSPAVIQNRSYTFPMRTPASRGGSTGRKNQASLDEMLEDSPLKDAILNTLRVTSVDDHFKAALNEKRTGVQKARLCQMRLLHCIRLHTVRNGVHKIFAGKFFTQNISELNGIEQPNVSAPAAANVSTFGLQGVLPGFYNQSQLDDAAQNGTLDDMRNATIYINSANDGFNIALDEVKKKRMPFQDNDEVRERNVIEICSN
uniref:Uncharacterized protein n=1 Tax=Romanomermis culicivorax TaxID=13658 RepID=A0A915IX44_ROMCU